MGSLRNQKMVVNFLKFIFIKREWIPATNNPSLSSLPTILRPHAHSSVGRQAESLLLLTTEPTGTPCTPIYCSIWYPLTSNSVCDGACLGNTESE